MLSLQSLVLGFLKKTQTKFKSLVFKYAFDPVPLKKVFTFLKVGKW